MAENYQFEHFKNFDLNLSRVILHENGSITIGPFTIQSSLSDKSKNCKSELSTGFSLNAPTTCRNVLRVARALYSNKPIMLEGSPGAGKSSLIMALAAATGHKLVRLNLSEQTVSLKMN